MAKRVRFQEMLSRVRWGLEAVPEHRKGRNLQYLIAQAGLGAFSVFFAQSPSLLAHQRHREQRHGRNNARRLFGVEVIPGDGQRRNLVDGVEPSYDAPR